jgi:hypothetical protein
MKIDTSKFDSAKFNGIRAKRAEPGFPGESAVGAARHWVGKIVADGRQSPPAVLLGAG